MRQKITKASAWLAAALLAMTLGACTLPATRLIDPPAETTSIFVASLRAGIASEAEQSERAEDLRYSMHTVSVPQQRLPGKVSLDRPSRNPETEFFDLDRMNFLDADAMMVALADTARALGRPDDVMVFVHGFNNSFDHGLKRIAEIDADYNAPIAKLLFDWPTDDELLNYAHDLDSAAFSRDGLEQVIDALAAHGFKRIVLTGYSMGAEIILETFRQMRIGKKDKILARIGGVAMIAPDVDVEVFLQNVKRMAPLPEPFVVYSSPNDWPLRSLQKYVYADKPRLGTITDLTPIADLPIYLITAPTSGEPAEARHLATSSVSVINAANAAGVDLVGFGPLAANVPGARVETKGRATRVALP